MNVSGARYYILWLVWLLMPLSCPIYVQEKNRYIARTAPSMNAIARRPM